MLVFILEERMKNSEEYELSAVVTKQHVADKFYNNDPSNRRWSQKRLDDFEFLKSLAKEEKR